MPDGAYELLQCSEAPKEDEIVWCASDDEGAFETNDLSYYWFKNLYLLKNGRHLLQLLMISMKGLKLSKGCFGQVIHVHC